MMEESSEGVVEGGRECEEESIDDMGGVLGGEERLEEGSMLKGMEESEAVAALIVGYGEEGN